MSRRDRRWEWQEQFRCEQLKDCRRMGEYDNNTTRQQTEQKDNAREEEPPKYKENDTTIVG